MNRKQQQPRESKFLCKKRADKEGMSSATHEKEAEEAVESFFPWISKLKQNVESSGTQIYEAALELFSAMAPQAMQGEKVAPEYVVAKFVDSNTLSVIHKTWMEIKKNKAYCYWPSSYAALKAKTREAPDKEKWRRYEIRVISFEVNWVKALRLLKKLKVLQSDPLVKKGTERVKRKRRYISESESETGDEFKKRVLMKLESIITNQRDQLSLLQEIAGLRRMHVEDNLISDLIPKPLNSKLDLLELSRVIQVDAAFRKKMGGNSSSIGCETILEAASIEDEVSRMKSPTLEEACAYVHPEAKERENDDIVESSKSAPDSARGDNSRSVGCETILEAASIEDEVSRMKSPTLKDQTTTLTLNDLSTLTSLLTSDDSDSNSSFHGFPEQYTDFSAINVDHETETKIEDLVDADREESKPMSPTQFFHKIAELEENLSSSSSRVNHNLHTACETGSSWLCGSPIEDDCPDFEKQIQEELNAIMRIQKDNMYSGVSIKEELETTEYVNELDLDDDVYRKEELHCSFSEKKKGLDYQCT